MQLLAGEANEFARDSVALLSSARTSLKVGLLCNAACLDAFACRLRRYKCVGSLSGTMCSRDDYTCVRKTQNGAFAQGQAEYELTETAEMLVEFLGPRDPNAVARVACIHTQ